MMTLAELHRRESYHLTGKKLGDRQLAVLLTIAKNRDGLSNADIAAKLSIPVNRVTGRTFELREMGIVGESGSKYDEGTGRNVTIWALTSGFIDFLKGKKYETC